MNCCAKRLQRSLCGLPVLSSTASLRLSLVADEGACLRPALGYDYRMAGYKRPPSRSEVRQMQRARGRIVFWCAAVVFFTVAGVAGLIYLLYASNSH